MKSILFLLLLTLPLRADPAYELSYILVRTSDHQVLAEQESDKLRIPASTLKVVTAVAALEQLGPEKTFHTTLAVDRPAQNGRLTGNLYLRGEADPELTTADLEEMALALRKEGVRTVEGDLVVDPGPYGFPVYGAGWAWDDAGQAYSSEVTGLSVNGGVVALRAGAPPDWIGRTDQEGVWLIPGREGALIGPELPEVVAAPRIALRTGELFRSLLRAHGIRIEGEVREGRAEGKPVVDHPSRALRKILKRALRESDNLAMELVYRAEGEKLPRVLENAPVRVVDGCGLSRYNLISARQLVDVLESAPAMRQLLVQPGEGTLEKRFLDGWAANHVVAKTGTMSNVSALTGYLFVGTEKECVFAILINGHLDSTAARKEIENELVEEWARRVGFPYVLE